jgi:hypothetical protein
VPLIRRLDERIPLNHSIKTFSISLHGEDFMFFLLFTHLRIFFFIYNGLFLFHNAG